MNPQDLVGLSPEQIMQISDMYSRNTDFGAGVQQFLDERRRAMEQENYNRMTAAEKSVYDRNRDLRDYNFDVRKQNAIESMDDYQKREIDSAIAQRNLMRDKYNRELESGVYNTYDITDAFGNTYKGNVAQALDQANKKVDLLRRGYDDYLKTAGSRGVGGSEIKNQWQLNAPTDLQKEYNSYFVTERKKGKKTERIPIVSSNTINTFNERANKLGFEVIPKRVKKFEKNWGMMSETDEYITVPVLRKIGADFTQSSVYEALRKIYDMSDEEARATVLGNDEALGAM